MSYAQAAATYQRNAVLTASPEKVVKLLYEGAIKHLEKCRVDLADPATSHSPEVGDSLSKAVGIIGELRASLDQPAGGDIARDLDRLYEFCLDRITMSNSTRTAEGVDSALQVMRTLEEGWDSVIPG